MRYTLPRRVVTFAVCTALLLGIVAISNGRQIWSLQDGTIAAVLENRSNDPVLYEALRVLSIHFLRNAGRKNAELEFGLREGSFELRPDQAPFGDATRRSDLNAGLFEAMNVAIRSLDERPDVRDWRRYSVEGTRGQATIWFRLFHFGEEDGVEPDEMWITVDAVQLQVDNLQIDVEADVGFGTDFTIAPDNTLSHVGADFHEVRDKNVAEEISDLQRLIGRDSPSSEHTLHNRLRFLRQRYDFENEVGDSKRANTGE